MFVVRAQHLGMCFGVKAAINQAFAAATRGPVTILGDLVHNDTVLAELAARAIQTGVDPDLIHTRTVMITAHGASLRQTEALRARHLDVLNATCPLVRAAHQAIARLVADDRHPVIVGQARHAEVRGMTEDLVAFDVVLTPEDVDRLAPHARFGIAAQTTQPVERVERLAARVQARFPDADVAVANTVCLPTRLRQQSAEDLARQVDMVIVVGGARSNNTRELVATCEQYCARVFHVQTADDIRAEWCAGVTTIGLTAGTSTPDTVIDAVERRLQDVGNKAVAA